MDLTVSGLGFDYSNGVKALDSIDFCLAEGGKLALLGPNGAGKTTLLLALAGLLPSRRFRGEVAWAGPGGKEPPGEVGFLFQNPDDQIVAATVEDDVGFSLLSRGMDPSLVSDRVGETLKLVRLEDKRRRLPLEMSFGEKKRVGLAGVLINHPRLLCLDEPSLGLDWREREELIRILASLTVTMVIASMDLEMVLQLADNALFLDRGRLVDQGSPRDLLEKEELRRRYHLPASEAFKERGR